MGIIARDHIVLFWKTNEIFIIFITILKFILDNKGLLMIPLPFAASRLLLSWVFLASPVHAQPSLPVPEFLYLTCPSQGEFTFSHEEELLFMWGIFCLGYLLSKGI